MTLLDEIIARDERYGDHIPDHYQAQLDRRNLLKMLDEAQEKAYNKGHAEGWREGYYDS